MSPDVDLLGISAAPAAEIRRGHRPVPSVRTPDDFTDPALVQGPGLILLAGTLAAVGSRRLRKALHRRRLRDSCLRPLAVGAVESVTDIVTWIRRDPFVGWNATAACTLLGNLGWVAEQVKRCRYSIVSVAPKSGRFGHRLRGLAWDLGDARAKLVVDPLNSLTSGVG